jgi:hypothetical protein
LVISSSNLSERRTLQARTPFVALQIIPKEKPLGIDPRGR